MMKDETLFKKDLDLFFDLLLKKISEGKIDFGEAESIFPQDVRNRACLEK